ncbi:hypothetical protein [uncultured Pseudoalteromonas sp.]|uniref:hypothetical protein n=1 Tax=uncultured Pseudoalteromonas sp. TaxID=114053 RepID=UPI002597016B|nr:hypothetical protein [uncultured Pseudoalteromonas sp.]
MSNNNGSSPVSERTFGTFEKVLAAAFTLLFAISAFVWNSHMRDFEKLDGKLDKLILAVNTIQNTMATKDDLLKLSDRVTQVEKEVAKIDYRVEHIEKKTP